jgi:hypothetical protein
MVDEEDRKNEKEKDINNIKKKNKFSLIFCCIFYQHFFNSIIRLKLDFWLIRNKKNIKEIFRIEALIIK